MIDEQLWDLDSDQWPKEVVEAAKVLYESPFSPHRRHFDPRANYKRRAWDLAPLYHRRLYLSRAIALYKAGLITTAEDKAHTMNEGFNRAAEQFPVVNITEKFNAATTCEVIAPDGRVLFRGDDYLPQLGLK